MRLRDKLITNLAVLRQQFDFAEIWHKQRLLIKEIGDIRPDLDRERLLCLQELLGQCVAGDGQLAETVPDALIPLVHWMEEWEELENVPDAACAATSAATSAEEDNAAETISAADLTRPPAPWPLSETSWDSEGAGQMARQKGDEKDRVHDEENWQSICRTLARAQGAGVSRKACLAGAAFAIYSLCGARFQRGDEEKVLAVLPLDESTASVFEGRILKRDLEALAGEDGDLIELEPRREPYRIPVWDYASQGGSLARVLYRNSAPRGGRDVELLVMDGSVILDRFLIKPGETLAVNLLDGLFVEAAPTLALSGSHCMFRDSGRRYGEEPFALKAYSFEEERIISYEMPALKRLTEYEPDDSGGFIGVLSPGGLPLPCSEKTEFRRIYEKRDVGRILLENATYLLLTKDGRVYSNLSRANGWNGMLRVFLSEDGDEAIGVRRDGSVIATRPDWDVSGLEGAFLIKTDGKHLGAKLPGGRFLVRKIGNASGDVHGENAVDNRSVSCGEETDNFTNMPPVKSFSLGAYGLRVLLMDGRLLENGEPVMPEARLKEYASEGENFAAVDDEGALWICKDGRMLTEGGMAGPA